MVTHMVFFVVKLLNYFPAKSGVSTQFSPKTIMSGQQLNYKQCSLPFGTYCQVHEEEGPRNSLIARTAGAISLGPSSNRQGGHLFMSLNTGRIISRRSWNVIPMPQTVIDHVNTMAVNQPRLLTFLDRNRLEIMDETDTTEHDHGYEIPGVVGNDAHIPGVDKEVAIEDTTIDTAVDNFEPENDMSNEPPTVNQAPNQLVDEVAPSQPVFDNTDDTMESMETPAEAAPPTEPISTNVHQRPTRVQAKPKTYVPSMKGKTYEYAATQISTRKFTPQIVELILTQVKRWGNDVAMNAGAVEMKQLHWRNTFKPVRWSELTEKQKATVLESHIFLTEKRTGEIKGRMVAGGNKQRGFIEKEDASSPTVATESVILTSLIDAEEKRDKAIIDVPNAFIQTFIKDKGKRVIVRIRGGLVDMLVKIAQETYKPFVTVNKKGIKQILVECLNALYGTIVEEDRSR
jgi:hypothetical protein